MKIPIKTQYGVAYKRDWDKLYFAVDIHDTVLAADYKPGSVGGGFFPGALEALRLLSQREEAVLIAFTSSYNHSDMLDFFRDQGIDFNYVNENPECGNTAHGDFSQKFYFNVLLDDKAGFEPETDWFEVLSQMRFVAAVEQEMRVPWRKP